MKTKMLFSNIAPSAALALATVLAALAVTVLLTQPLQAGYPEWVQIQTDPESTPVAREAHAMVYDEQRGVVVLHGGVNGDRRDLPEGGEILSDTWEWDGTDWTRVSTTGPATFWHGMAYDAARGVTVLFGGRDPKGPPAQKIALRDTWEWNGESWMKIEGGEGEVGLYSPAMAYDPGRGKVIRHGGASSGDGFDQNTTWEWDGQTWTKIADDGPRLAIGNLIYDAVRDTMVMFGGAQGLPPLPVPLDTWELDAAGDWTKIATGGPGRAFTGFVFDSSRNVGVLYGGVVGTTLLKDTWEWDGAEWTEKDVSGLGERVFHAMAYDSKRKKVVLFSGADCLFCGEQKNDIWEYGSEPVPPPPAEWVQIQTNPESTPVAREFHAMVYDEQRGVVVLHGGVKGNRQNPGPDDILSDTWVWNGTEWSRVSTTGPTAWAHGMAYDAARGVTVLFGGRDPKGPPAQKIALRDTWEWNGESWMKIEGGEGEVGLYSPAMAYDPGRGKVIRHGGASSGDGFDQNTTWEWDGQTWTEIANDGPVRGGGHFIYDEVRESMVLFAGGESIGPWVLPPDTWELDAAGDWSRIATVGPGRVFTGFVFDSHRNVGVLYGGGIEPGSPLGADTWEWDGAEWTEKDVSGPKERIFHAMAYDSKRNKVVLFGGAHCDFCARQKNDTWEYGLAPLEITSIERERKPNGAIVLQWRGEAPPYQLQVTTTLTGGDWQNLGEPTEEFTMTVLSDADAAYFRVVSLFGAE